MFVRCGDAWSPRSWKAQAQDQEPQGDPGRPACVLQSPWHATNGSPRCDACRLGFSGLHDPTKGVGWSWICVPVPKWSCLWRLDRKGVVERGKAGGKQGCVPGSLPFHRPEDENTARHQQKIERSRVHELLPESMTRWFQQTTDESFDCKRVSRIPASQATDQSIGGKRMPRA